MRVEPAVSSDGIKNARFPVLKTLDEFQWSWPKKINRQQIQNLFRLAFIATQTNIVLIGNVGLGKTHLSIALGRTACLNGHTVFFTTAVDIINTLAAARHSPPANCCKREFHRYTEARRTGLSMSLGYLPIDKHGADLLFQIISQRYERAPMVITTNRAYKQHWPQISQQRQHLDLRHPHDRVPAPRRHGLIIIRRQRVSAWKEEVDE